MKKPDSIKPANYDGIIINYPEVLLQKKLQPLDFFCVRGTGFISWAIRYITKNLSPDRECDYNHAGLLPDGTACTLEALWHIESKNLFEHYEGCKVLIGRYTELTPEKYLAAMKSICRHIDQSYPKRRLLLHLLNLAHHIHWINAVVCSELVAKALFNAGARNHNYWGTTPDTIADEIHEQLNKSRTGPNYQIIYNDILPWLIYKYCFKCKQIYFMPIADKHCYHCKQKLLNEEAVPKPEPKYKITEYNKIKLEYISKTMQKGETKCH